MNCAAIPRLFLASLLLILGTAAVSAQDATQPQGAQSGAIELEVGATDDAGIAGRIRSIFEQIPALRAVEVQVSAGVVNLRGAVPAAEDVERAEAIAARVAGVVTIENDVTRDLALDANLAPTLGGLGEFVRGFVRAMPLIGVAVLIAALIGVAGYVMAARSTFLRAVTPNAFMAELVATSIRFLFMLIGIVAALEILGATALLGAVLGGAGVAGIALGFAVRDTIDNYVSSLMLSLRQPFRANDHVVIEGHEGRVVRLTSRATILMTLDGNHLRIPNAMVFKAVILNYTRNPERRFAFDLGVDASDDPVQAMAVGLVAVNELPFVLDSPQAKAIIQDVGDSNILLRFYGWVDQVNTDFHKGRSLAIQAAKCALESAGFALPEPIYRLRFDEGASLPPMKIQPREARPIKANPRDQLAPQSSQDTAPERYVEQLVRQERAAGLTEDLLDDRKPVE